MDKQRNKKVAIIDYQLSNLFSVRHVCNHIGLNAVITSDKDTLLDSDAAILPGVGAFVDAMENLKRLDLIHPIKDFIASGRLFVGICLGMQLLFSQSEEFGNAAGLDIIPGRVVKFNNMLSDGSRVKVPHMGWSPIYMAGATSALWSESPLSQIKAGEYMYFVHSYYAVPDDPGKVLSVTNYAEKEFCSSILDRNVFATQFHPEKSAREGIKIYRGLASMIEKWGKR